MEDLEKRQEDILQRAAYLQQRTTQLIAELDNWMPCEQANANLEREIIERRRERKAVARTNLTPPPQTVARDNRSSPPSPQLKLSRRQKIIARFDRLLCGSGD